jgi:hypothetical protein
MTQQLAIIISDSNSIHTQITEDRKAAFPEASLLKVFRRYYRGRQNATYTPAQSALLRGVIANRKADNLCKKVVNETANRLELVRFNVAEQRVGDFLAELYIKNQLADLSGDIHVAALRDGNFCLALNWDMEAGRVTLHKERWWNGEDGIFVAYSDTNKTQYVVKDWTERNNRKRRVIWWPDRIERYILVGEGWQQYQLPEDNGRWPVPWTRPGGEPLGIPIVHFANGSDNDSTYGASLLDGGVLGLQDDVNDAQTNITSTARLTGAQMIYATGITLEVDELSGTEKTLKVGPGAVFTSENEGASFGAIPAGDLSQLKEAYMVKLQAIARMTNTPLHLITGGNWPSGEALLQAQMPLIQQVETLAKTVGPAWATLAHRATQLANAFGKAGLDEESLIQAVFAPSDKKDPLTQSAVAEKIAPFVSKKEVLRTLGYGPQAIDQILKELSEETTQAHLLSVGDNIPVLPAGRVQ